MGSSEHEDVSHEFKVVFSGAALSTETVVAIDAAIQRAVSTALADLDLGSGYRLLPLNDDTSDARLDTRTSGLHAVGY
jgi:hypothetical protein